jgi:hypothetical protein
MDFLGDETSEEYSERAKTLLKLANEKGISHDGLDDINGTIFYVYHGDPFKVIKILDENGFSDWSEISGVTKFNRSFTIKNNGDGYEFG